MNDTPASARMARPSLTLLTRLFWPEAFGGVERRTRCMAEAFTHAGVDVHVVTRSKDGGATARAERLDPGYTVARLPQIEPGWQWRWRELVAVRAWARAARAHAGPGWVWATDPLPAAGAIHAGFADRLIYNPPWCAAGMQAAWRGFPDAWTLRTRRLLRRIERRVYRRAARIVVASDNLAEQFESAYGARPGLHRVAHGVDNPPGRPAATTDARRSFGIDEKAMVVGLVSRLDPFKDVPFLLRAVAAAGEAVDRVLIAGDGPDRPRIQTTAERLGVAHRLVWAGHQPDPTPAYRAMDAMVLCSLHEPFGNVVLESMAAGTPVIGRRRSAADPPVLVANDQLIDPGQSGFLVDPRDPIDLARLLQRLAADPNRLRAMRPTAQAAAAERPWSMVINAYLRVMGLADSAADPVQQCKHAA